MRTICLLFLALLSLSVNAQRNDFGAYGRKNARLPQVMPLDTSMMECIYSHRIYDPVLLKRKRLYMILEVGRDFSKFSNYGYYRTDSIIKADYSRGITVNEYFKLCDLNKASFAATVIKDFNDGIVRSYDKVYIDNYIYEEPVADIQWTLDSETKTICGYTCNKATASFRGRKWVAWYCELPFDNGPWKFGNLPGLILRVEDENKEHIFEAISIRKSNTGFGLDKRAYQKTSREKFNEASAEFHLNPGDFVVATPIVPKDRNGKPAIPNRRLFFNPIEKE